MCLVFCCFAKFALLLQEILVISNLALAVGHADYCIYLILHV